MVNNQEWFSKEYPKEEREIEFEDEKFEGRLVIENYLELKELYLHNIESIDKITLKNLPQLQKCTIWDCGLQDLAIENCPQLKTLNVRRNLLTNLEFLASLESLEKLEIDGNAKLIEILEPYQGNWKIHKKFLNLQKENEELKESKHQLKEFLKKEVLNPLNELDKKIERSGSFSEDKNTQELMTITKEDVKKVKGIKNELETELAEKGSKIQKLEKELAGTEKKLTSSQEELEAQQLALESLEKKLRKTPSDNELKKKVDKYKTKIQELKKEEEGLKIELAGTKAKLERAEDEVHHWRERSSTPVQQNNFLSGNQSNLNLAISGSFNQSNQTIYQIQYNDQQLQKELTELKQNYQLLEPANESPSDRQKLKKTILFLGAKQIFAAARKNTISDLIDNYNNLNESGQKFDKMVTLGEYVSNSGWIADFIPAPGTGTAVNLLGKGVSAMANFFKSNSFAEHAQKFENYLIEDEKSTFLLNKTYQSLVDSLQGNQSKISPVITEILKLNENQLSSYDIFTVGNIQKGEELTMEKMKEAINSLTNDLKEFGKKLQQEKDQYAEKMEVFFAGTDGELLQKEITKLLNKLNGQEESIPIEQQPDLANKITAKENTLKELIISVKVKLASKSTFAAKTKEREEKLEAIFNNLPSIQEEFIKALENIKPELSKKLAQEEINNLYQTNQELGQLKLSLQSQHQPQIIQNQPFNILGSSKK